MLTDLIFAAAAALVVMIVYLGERSRQRTSTRVLEWLKEGSKQLEGMGRRIEQIAADCGIEQVRLEGRVSLLEEHERQRTLEEGHRL